MTQATSRQEQRQPGVRLHLALWLLVLLPGALLQAAALPQRVVSINLCADQLLLMLADADQVASVSHLAIEPLSSFVAGQARNFPLNHAKAEEIIALQPDLVLATEHNSPRLLTTLESLGYRVERLQLGRRPAQIVENLRHMATILGQPERGERLIRRFQSRLGEASSLPPEGRPGALFYQPRGYTSGRGTLQHEALRLAGWRNLAAEEGIEGYAQIDMEQLLRWRPKHVFTSVYDGSGDSLAERQLKHPALKRLLAGRALVSVPYRYWICPGPMLAEAVDLLRKARHELDSAPPPPGGQR